MHIRTLKHVSFISTRPGTREGARTSFIILPVDKRNNNWSSLVNGITFPSFFFFFSKIIPKEEMMSIQQQMFQCLMNFCALQRHVFFQEGRKNESVQCSSLSSCWNCSGEPPVLEVSTPRLQTQFHQ